MYGTCPCLSLISLPGRFFLVEIDAFANTTHPLPMHYKECAPVPHSSQSNWLPFLQIFHWFLGWVSACLEPICGHVYVRNKLVESTSSMSQLPNESQSLKLPFSEDLNVFHYIAGKIGQVILPTGGFIICISAVGLGSDQSNKGGHKLCYSSQSMLRESSDTKNSHLPPWMSQWKCKNGQRAIEANVSCTFF